MSVATPTVAQAVLKAVKVAKDPEFDRNVLGSLRKAEDHHASKTLAATTAGGASPAGNGINSIIHNGLSASTGEASPMARDVIFVMKICSTMIEGLDVCRTAHIETFDQSGASFYKKNYIPRHRARFARRSSERNAND
jgi:hypothetical protein